MNQAVVLVYSSD